MKRYRIAVTHVLHDEDDDVIAYDTQEAYFESESARGDHPAYRAVEDAIADALERAVGKDQNST